MASTFKLIDPTDISSTKTLLYENIPVTGSIVSGTYAENNIYNYTHGMFQTVFDYPYASSSANNLFDITVGHNSSAPSYGSSNAFNTKKTNIYNQMAKILAGYDYTGSILKFDEDGDLASSTSDKINNAFFITFSRLLVKDEIKKGSFSMTLALSGNTVGTAFSLTGTVADVSASSNSGILVNSPVGEYAPLYLTDVTGAMPNTDRKVGLIFYQAGVVVLSSNIFAASSSAGVTTSMSSNQRGQLLQAAKMFNLSSSYDNVQKLFESGSIQTACDSLRTRIGNITFKNTTELNSTIYFLKINNNEFNYSSNPTYLTGSQIRVKTERTDASTSYITTVGLYSADNELLAVAKLSEPLKKTEEQSLLLRVRLDY